MLGRYNNIRIDGWINKIQLAIVNIEEEDQTVIKWRPQQTEKDSNPSTTVITPNMTTVVREETTGLINIFPYSNPSNESL